MKSLGNFPDPFWTEISGQPDACRRAAEAVAASTEALDRLRSLTDGRHLIVTGMGSSYDAAYPAIATLAEQRIPAIHVTTGELIHFRSGLLGPSAAVIAVSQSGESAEVVRLARAIGGERGTLIAVTNGTANTVASLADLAFDTRAGDETGPSTMTFAASLVTLAAVARRLGGEPAGLVADGVVDEAASVAAAIERIVGDVGFADRLTAWFGDRGTLMILGRGPARAAAEMAALTLKEAVGIAVESLETAQFRHGPLELVGPDLAVMMIATEEATLDLDLRFAAELSGGGARVFTVTAGTPPPAGIDGWDLGPIAGPIVPAASVVPAQLLAWGLAPAHGRERGAYYRASKVTTVE